LPSGWELVGDVDDQLQGAAGAPPTEDEEAADCWHEGTPTGALNVGTFLAGIAAALQPTPGPEAAQPHRSSPPLRETEAEEFARLMSQVTLPPPVPPAAQGVGAPASAAVLPGLVYSAVSAQGYRPGREVRLVVALEGRCRQRLRAALTVWRVAPRLARARWVLLAAGLRGRGAGRVKVGQLAARAIAMRNTRRRPRGGPGDQTPDYGVANLDGVVHDAGAEAIAAQSPVFLSPAEFGVCADGRWVSAAFPASPKLLQRKCRTRTKRPAGLHQRLRATKQTVDEHCRGHERQLPRALSSTTSSG
jgi:hypothetical protein